MTIPQATKTVDGNFVTDEEFIAASVECRTCDGSGEVMGQLKHREIYLDCPMCEGEGRVTESQLAEYGGKWMTEDDAEERVLDAYFGEG
jgi:DnaJ-class molecular chaperone